MPKNILVITFLVVAVIAFGAIAAYLKLKEVPEQ